MKLEKVTRSYDDACGTAHALDLIGERWALLVMRELLLGPRRFGDLRANLPGISANVLTQRLEGLEAAGLLARRKLSAPASVQVYELTEWGQEVEPILLAMGRWAIRSPKHDPTLPLSPVALMLSFKAKFDPEKAAGLTLTVGFRYGEEIFTVRVAEGVLTIERGETARAEVWIGGSTSGFAAVAYGKQPAQDVEKAGLLTVEGRLDSAQAFADIFEMPPKAV